MNRTKSLKVNASVSLLSRLVILINGLILPRLILTYYGSEINGLVSSINQYLNIITFLDMGVGAVVQSALYKPLAKQDEEKISLILVSATKYFQKIAFFLVIYVFFLAVLFPIIIHENINYLAVTFLIISMSINKFSQFYFGIVNELLLNADQKSYIQLFSEIITILISTLISIVLILNGFSIILVKLVGAFIYLFRPIFLQIYVSRNYKINYSIELTEEPLEQKWYGVAQHVASVVFNSTDTIVLSIFSTLENISIYSVYNMVVNGIRLIMTSLLTGTQSFVGNLLANNETKLLNLYFTKIEWVIHNSVTLLFGLTSVLITPFVLIYTSGVEDANYYAPIFSYILVMGQALYCVRIPYNTLILAAGHYKETQKSAVIEVVINIVLSVILVNRYGLIGIAIGTSVAMIYRTGYIVYYLTENIIYRPLILFVKHILTDILSLSIFYSIYSLFTINYSLLINWILWAILLTGLFLLILLVINLIFYRDITLSSIKRILKVN